MVFSLVHFRKKKLLAVAKKWGAFQKSELEQELAYMKKQLAGLWELTPQGAEIPVKIQKVLALFHP